MKIPTALAVCLVLGFALASCDSADMDGGCGGYSSTGTAVVDGVNHEKAGYESDPNRDFVDFTFTPSDSSEPPTQMTMSLAKRCITDEGLLPRASFVTSAWIRTSGTCMPYSMSFQAPSCES